MSKDHEKFQIEMRLCPTVEPDLSTKPLLIENEDGIQFFVDAVDAGAVRRMYFALSGSFDSKVEFLKNLREPFFNIDYPDVRLTLVERN